MSRSAEGWRARARTHLPWIAVTILGLAILWPVPLVHMPLSADHTVHLTRIWMQADALASGQPRAWSPVWFFGTPVGDLYPVLGDLVVIAVRVLGLGLLDWAQAYAIGFTLVFVSQGWAMLRLGKVAGAAPWAGLVGAALVLCDAGAYREGGWIYTVSYGVWPQALATTFTWLAIAELALAVDTADPRAHARAIVRGAVCVAAAMLAHPVTLPVLAIVALVAVALYGAGGRRALAEIVVAGASILALGLALCAWWFVPLTIDRGWMVSYGWLWLPLERMIAAATRGHLAQNVPVAITVAVALGIVVVAVVGSRPARLFTAAGIALWAWTSADSLWSLRLDLVAPSSTQVQWQRFLVAARPGLFFAAGFGLVAIARGGVRLWRGRWRPAAIAVWLAIAALGGWIVRDEAATMRSHGVGAPQIERDPEDAALAADYAALCRHLATLWAERDDDWRMTVVAPRNSHWFMDAPVTTGMPLYKQGFTPGDNFVHKPEAGTPELLDRLGVRWVVTRKRGSMRDADVVATFGSLKLWERRSWSPTPTASVRGVASVEAIEDDLAGDGVVVRVENSTPDDLLVFAVGGYPRWELRRDGEPVEWFEVPAIGDGPIATQAERRAGLWRGGKADGDDGTEPTLLAANASDGTWELRYRLWRTIDVLAALVSLAAVFVVVTLAWPRGRRDGAAVLARVRGFVGARLRPWMVVGLAVLALALAIRRCRSGTDEESTRAIGWVDRGLARTNLQAGPLKTDMLVRPAVVLDPRVRRRSKPAEAVFPAVELAPRLTGWFALDDDAAKLARQGTHRLAIEARTSADGEWIALHDAVVPHRPGRSALAVATGELAGQRVDLRVRIDSDGGAPPTMGFDLDLGEPQDGP